MNNNNYENEERVFCDDCGRDITEEDRNELDRGDLVCDNCYDSYSRCFCCNEEYDSEGSGYVDHYGNNICDNCRNNFYYYCDGCNDLYPEDDLYYDEASDNYYCRDCQEEYGSIIRGYHNRDIDIIYKYTEEDLEDDTIYATKETEHTPDNMLKFGMEIEVENNDYNIQNEEMARRIRNKYPELELVFEEDSSLSDGFEIITQPMTYRYIQENAHKFEDICKMLKEFGFRSHNGGHCGQHVHFSKCFLQPDEEDDKYIQKLLLFFERYKNEIYNFSRRTDTRWSAFVSDTAGYDKKYYKSGKILCDYAKTHAGHGVAINLENRNTIEIRIFRGTLKFETMMANFEFVNSLAHIIKETQTRYINFDKVVNYKDNKYIQDYCINKNIYNSEYMSDETENIFRILKIQTKRLEDIKKDVKNNIENISNELLEVLKTLFDEIPSFDKSNDCELQELFRTTRAIQDIVTNSLSLLNNDILKETDNDIENNYSNLLYANWEAKNNEILRYYTSIRNYIPATNKTSELLARMDETIELLNKKYNNVIGGEV